MAVNSWHPVANSASNSAFVSHVAPTLANTGKLWLGSGPGHVESRAPGVLDPGLSAWRFKPAGVCDTIERMVVAPGLGRCFCGPVTNLCLTGRFPTRSVGPMAGDDYLARHCGRGNGSSH